MEDLPDSDRPAKRMKQTHNASLQQQAHQFTFSVSGDFSIASEDGDRGVSGSQADPVADLNNVNYSFNESMSTATLPASPSAALPPSVQTSPSRSWQSNAWQPHASAELISGSVIRLPETSPGFLFGGSHGYLENDFPSEYDIDANAQEYLGPLGAEPPAATELGEGSLLGEVASSGDSASETPTPSQKRPQPRTLLPATAKAAGSSTSKSRRSRSAARALTSPFADCVGTFGQSHEVRFADATAVDSYVKFAWRSKEEREKQARLEQDTMRREMTNLPINAAAVKKATQFIDQAPLPEGAELCRTYPPPPMARAITLAGPAPPSTTVTAGSPTLSASSLSSPDLSPSTSGMMMSRKRWPFAVVMLAEDAAKHATGSPQYPPADFGMSVKMDTMDKQLWVFYTDHWCPGRSILDGTNLWLKDFAQMESSDGVRAAIQALAGVYIYDYTFAARVRHRVNQRFAQAEDRLSRLMSRKDHRDSEEIITICCILSMQDVILAGRRVRKPLQPRWLQGFELAEGLLQASDPGARFWNKESVQVSSLRAAQSVLVGRAVIMTETMTALPDPSTFDFDSGSNKFSWLMHGTREEQYEIHGGCGFSKRLLFTIHQIAFCAAHLVQDPETPITPMTSKYLWKELMEMRQWSRESITWDELKKQPALIEWFRTLEPGFKIEEPHEMTHATAEAWRIATMIYLQCRLWRLPRNHPEVVSALNDLAICIRIMPTKGKLFTAQAPLFPVFLLGLLSTTEFHRQTSETWFEKVSSEPVRSSVPPLFETLKRTWKWIDFELPLASPQDLVNLPARIVDRHPWWEDLVATVHKKEPETLYLT